MQTELCIFPTNCLHPFFLVSGPIIPPLPGIRNTGASFASSSSSNIHQSPRLQMLFLSPSSSFHDSDPISAPQGFLLRPICEPPVWFPCRHNLPHKLWSVTHPTNMYRAFLLLTLRAPPLQKFSLKREAVAKNTFQHAGQT